MCIIFIAARRHENYPLIIAANRDEYHARPSAFMAHWREQPGILAGRDMRAGGTWFGVNQRGRIAAVTNRHDAESLIDGRSRGELVARFLRDEESVAGYQKFLCNESKHFNPHNLIYGDADKLFCSDGDKLNELSDGFHSISNNKITDPLPKMSRGVALLEAQISATPTTADTDAIAEQLTQMMRDQTDADDRRASIFVSGETYGTRTTTLLFATAAGYEIYEYNYDNAANEIDRRKFLLALSEKN